MSRNSSVSTTVSTVNYDGSRHNYHRLSQDVLWDRGTSPAPQEEISRQKTENTVNLPLCDMGRRSQVTGDVTHWDSASARLESDGGGTPTPQQALSLPPIRTLRRIPTWAMEILSLVVATLCLCAIVMILRTHEHRTLPEWPYHITINALVATFTAIFKGALIMPIAEGISQSKWIWFSQPRELADIERFDTASRGPWGSLLLSFSRIPGRNTPWMTNLGAILTITALAVDPFSQQIIRYYSCMEVSLDSVARIPKAQTLTKKEIPIDAASSALKGGTAAAIYMGLIDAPANSSAGISIICPTGNCTFPQEDGATFSSLAFCGSCVNISDEMFPNRTDGQRTTVSVPSGLTLDQGVLVAKADDCFHYSSLFEFESLMMTTPLPGGAECGSGMCVDSYYPAFAIRCSINPCLKTFAANISNYTYEETELSSTNLYSNDGNRLPQDRRIYPMFSIATNTTLRNGTWKSCNPSTRNDTSNTIPINTTSMTLADDKVSDQTTTLWYPVDCFWQVDGKTTLALSQYLQTLFDQKVLLSMSSYMPEYSTGDLWLLNLINNGDATIDSVNQYITSLAWSMTASMRQTATDTDGDLAFATGNVLAPQTCISVRWVWISLPAVLLGLSICFLAIIIAMTRSGKWKGDWRSSPLALLFQGLEENARHEGETVKGKAAMFSAAKGFRVQLREENRGWRFYKVE